MVKLAIPLKRKDTVNFDLEKKMDLYSYVLRHDDGFAPNPFHNALTLATCKPVIRRKAKVGDYVIGTGSKPRNDKGNLMYIMQVNEVLSMEDYAKDSRFANKIPNMNSNRVMQSGDNIYEFDEDMTNQRDSLHRKLDGSVSEKDKIRDMSGKSVLISNNFVYFGDDSRPIPERFKTTDNKSICQLRQSHRKLNKKNFPLIDEFIEWAYSQDVEKNQILGNPASWSK